jgi:predicted amidohydrolase
MPRLFLSRTIEDGNGRAGNYNGTSAAGDARHPPFCGRSAVVGPDGMDLARAPGTEAHHRSHTCAPDAAATPPTACVCDALIDPAAFEADVRRNPYLTARRPELYGTLAEHAAQAAVSSTAAPLN